MWCVWKGNRVATPVRNFSPVAFATFGRLCGAGPVVARAEQAIDATHDCARPYCDRRPVALSGQGYAFTLLRGKGGSFFARSDGEVLGVDGQPVLLELTSVWEAG